MPKKRPNILFLMNDHQAYYRHGWSAGAAPQRPNFDRLAAGGVEFTRCYSGSPLCGPVRRSILTGLLPHNHGEIQNDSNAGFQGDTYLELLAKAGYRNFYYGKWHAGPGTAHDHACEGFSYPSYNNPYTKPEYKSYLQEMNLPEPGVRIENVVQYWGEETVAQMRESMRTGEPYVQDKAWCNEHAWGVMTTPKETHESFFLAHLACRKLRELAADDSGEPFHLRVDFWGPHPPYFPTPEFAEMFDPEQIPPYPSLDDTLEGKPECYRFEANGELHENRRLIQPNPMDWSEWRRALARCYAQTAQIDAAGGMILDALDELGLADDTLVLWTTDHGDGVACHGGHFDKDSYLPEEVLRIPMAARWPAAFPGGRKYNRLVSNVDAPATMLAAAGTRFEGRSDARDLSPLMENPNAAWAEEIVCETHGHHYPRLGRALIAERWKYVFNLGDVEELYDLETDPYELRNVAADAACAEILEDMRARLDRVRQANDDQWDAPDSPWSRALREREGR